MDAHTIFADMDIRQAKVKIDMQVVWIALHVLTDLVPEYTYVRNC